MRLRLAPVDIDEVTVVPANEASCADLDAVFGIRGYAARCRCQWFKTGHPEWSDVPVYERIERNRVQARCGEPDAPTTSGLLAYVDGEPVGWCAVEPRSAYPALPPKRSVLRQRGEDPADSRVWALTCFAVRAGHRRRGITYALARAAVAHARDRGARALEAYPMLVEPGQDVTWGELHVGNAKVLATVGFREVAHPTLRRLVMRIDFE